MLIIQFIIFISGGLLGVICTSLFQKKVDSYTDKYLRILKGKLSKRKVKFIPFNFSFGPLETSGIVMDGSVKEVYSKENIHCHFEPSPITLPEDLQDIKNVVKKDQEKKKKRGDKHMWNSKTYGLTSFTRSRTDEDEDLELHLYFRPSDWFNHCATGLSLDKHVLIDHVNKKSITPREKYLNAIDWSSPDLQPTPYFSNTFSVAMCLVTADNILILVQRSGSVVNPDQFSISVNETLQYSNDKSETNAPDLYGVVKRGTLEEMGFKPEDQEISFFSLCMDTDSCCWGIQGMIKSNKTFQEINDCRRNKAKDKYENKKLFALDFSISSIVKFVLNNEPWPGGSTACIYYTLTHYFDHEKVDAALKKYGRSIVKAKSRTKKF